MIWKRFVDRVIGTDGNWRIETIPFRTDAHYFLFLCRFFASLHYRYSCVYIYMSLIRSSIQGGCIESEKDGEREEQTRSRDEPDDKYRERSRARSNNCPGHDSSCHVESLLIFSVSFFSFEYACRLSENWKVGICVLFDSRHVLYALVTLSINMHPYIYIFVDGQSYPFNRKSMFAGSPRLRASPEREFYTLASMRTRIFVALLLIKYQT